MKKPREWSYPEEPAKFEEPGAFEAWVVASDIPDRDHSPGVSGFAAEVRRRDSLSVSEHDVRTSEGTESGEERAYVAGVARILEMLPTGSSVTIHCRATFIVDGLNLWLDDWSKRNWKRVKNAEIWRRVLKVRDERRLTINAVHCRKGKSPHEEKFEELRAKARAAVVEQGRALGLGTAGFDALEEEPPVSNVRHKRRR